MNSKTRETIILQLARQHTLNALDANCPIDGHDELVAAGRDLRRFGDTDDRIMAEDAEQMMNTHNEQTCPTCNPERNHTMNNIETNHQRPGGGARPAVRLTPRFLDRIAATGLTDAAIAATLGVSEQLYGRVKRGETAPSVRFLAGAVVAGLADSFADVAEVDPNPTNTNN